MFFMNFDILLLFYLVDIEFGFIIFGVECYLLDKKGFDIMMSFFLEYYFDDVI